MAAILAFLIAYGSSFIADRSISLAAPVIVALRIVALMLALGFLIFAISFFINFETSTLITKVLAPRAIKTSEKSSNQLFDCVGRAASKGIAGIWPTSWVSGERCVPAPTAIPAPLRYESAAIAAFGR